MSEWEIETRKEPRWERLSAEVSGVGLHFLDETFDTRGNVYKMDVRVMTKGLTWAQEAEVNELDVTQVNNLCGRGSALVTKGSDDGTTLVRISLIHSRSEQ